MHSTILFDCLYFQIHFEYAFGRSFLNETHMFTRNILTDLSRAIGTTKRAKELLKTNKLTFDTVALKRCRFSIYANNEMCV